MTRFAFFLTIVFVVSMTGSLALADSATFSVNLSGAQEVPGPGDLDGSASGLISLDDVLGEISWNFSYADIASPSAMHIHGPGGSAGNPAGVHIGLGVATSGGAGTLIGSLAQSVTSGITAVLDDPADFYVNIHNSEFGAGAVRGQVPEPNGMMLLLLSLPAGLLLRRR